MDVVAVHADGVRQRGGFGFAKGGGCGYADPRMSHITEIALENYRSFRSARCRLSPFTLIVGANNSGKSNFMKAIRDISALNAPREARALLRSAGHHAQPRDIEPTVSLIWSDGKVTKSILSNSSILDIEVRLRMSDETNVIGVQNLDGTACELSSLLEIYRLDPDIVGSAESAGYSERISANGLGVSRLLEKWNSGSRAMRTRFEQVEAALRRCVPEIERVSFYDVDVGKRAIQVEQTGLPEPRPLSEVSDGTRLVLAILTLVNLESPPPVLLLEDIDRGLHPRLYEQLVDFLRSLAAEGRTQILATTHDPYLIDEFRDTPEAVVIVEKKDGASTLSNLDERLKVIYAPGEELGMPLGQVWFSGLVGGVPKMKLPEILKVAEQ